MTRLQGLFAVAAFAAASGHPVLAPPGRLLLLLSPALNHISRCVTDMY